MRAIESTERSTDEEASRRRAGIHHFVPAFALVMSLALSGCAISNSFSESSGSVSESVSDSSESSSDSSGSSSGGDSQAYREEVRDYVALAALRDASPDTLRRGVTEIALGFGISDWEAVPSTWDAIDRGLAEVPAPARDGYRQALIPAHARSGAQTHDVR